MRDNIIYDITPFTHVDFPDKLAAIAWFAGCNMRCQYCYNPEIVFAKQGNYTPEDLFEFLSSRTGMLDGMVFSGGEATLYDLEPIAKKIREMGFVIKLDTNGTNPKRINELISKSLIDYIALDFKADKVNYRAVTGMREMKPFLETLDLLIDRAFPFEVRTTVHPDLLSKETIKKIADLLADREYRGTYYLQQFQDVDNTVGDIASPTVGFKWDIDDMPLPVIWR